MTKIARKTQKLFASGAGPQDIGQFGSFAAGAVAYSTDPAVIQGLSNFSTGWFGAVDGENAAALEDRNALDYLWAYQLSSIFQDGLPVYDAGTTYYAGSLVNDGNGNVRVSTVDSNTGNGASLLTDAAGTHWRVPAGHVPIGAVIATFPNLTGAYSTTATTVADASGWVKCAGQTLADATSPMNGDVIPNINNSIFLMGSTTAGTAGGSNTQNLSHNHNYAHYHQTSYVSSSGSGGATTWSQYSLLTPSTSYSSFTTGTGTYNNLSQNESGANGSSQSGNYLVFGMATGTWYTSGVSGGVNGTGGSAQTDTQLGSAIDTRPAFITAVYLMRVK